MRIGHSILAVAALASVVTVNAAPRHDPVWLQRLQRWMLAATDHHLRTADDEARAVAAWPRADLESVLADLLALRDSSQRRRNENSNTWKSRVISRGSDVVRIPQLQQLFGLTDDEMQRGDWNRILWAGALLHSDVAMLVSPEDRRGTRATLSMRFRDGQLDGYEYPVGSHWEMARKLLDAVRPDPSHDQAVLFWYRATAAHLLSTLSLSDAMGQLDRGRQLFPSDAELLFLSGCAHEAYTAPDFQSAVRAFSPPPGQTLDVGSARSHLQQAQALFGQAFERNAHLPEARVRLGHVLGLLGRHQEAADQLRAVAANVGDPRLFYYACLLLGDEERRLGHPDAAREWFERAEATYSRAQSPLLALSHLALAAGDDRAAVQAIARVRDLPVNDRDGDDPWVEYYLSAGRRAPELFDAFMAALPEGVRR